MTLLQTHALGDQGGDDQVGLARGMAGRDDGRQVVGAAHRHGVAGQDDRLLEFGLRRARPQHVAALVVAPVLLDRRLELAGLARAAQADDALALLGAAADVAVADADHDGAVRIVPVHGLAAHLQGEPVDAGEPPVGRHRDGVPVVAIPFGAVAPDPGLDGAADQHRLKRDRRPLGLVQRRARGRLQQVGRRDAEGAG